MKLSLERPDLFPESDAIPYREPRALPRAPEKSLPFAIEDLEGPLEPIPDEFSPEELKAHGRPKRAIFVNSSVDVGRTSLKPCLAQHNLAFDGQLYNGSLALPIS
jgi:hypothetical protein